MKVLIFGAINTVELVVGAYYLGLNAVYKLSRKLTRKAWIFGEILKVSAAKRGALHVCAGAQKYRYFFLNTFFAERFAHFIKELFIP